MRTDVQSKTHFPKGARVAKVAINFLLVIIPLYQHPLTSATLPSFSSFYLSHPFISWLYLQSLSSFFLEIPASLFFLLPCIFSLFHSLNPLEMFWPTFPSLPFNLFSHAIPAAEESLEHERSWVIPCCPSWPSSQFPSRCLCIFIHRGWKYSNLQGWLKLKLRLQTPGTKCFIQLPKFVL